MRIDRIGDFIDDGSPVIGTVTAFAPGAMPDAHAHARGQLAWCPDRPVTVLAGQDLHLVSPGSAIWLPPGCVHRIAAPAARRSVNLYALPGSAPLPDRSACFALTGLERELIGTLAAAGRAERREAAFGRLAAVLWDRLARAAARPAPPRLPMPDHPGLRRIALALVEGEDCPTDAGSLDEWAGTLALSRRSLQRLVLRETGRNWRDWTQHLRLARAFVPLMSGQSVQGAAHAAGYASASGFVAAFRARYGITPGRIRPRLDAG